MDNSKKPVEMGKGEVKQSEIVLTSFMDGHLQRNRKYIKSSEKKFYVNMMIVCIPNLLPKYLEYFVCTLNKQNSIGDLEQKILSIFCRTLSNCQGFATIND